MEKQAFIATEREAILRAEVQRLRSLVRFQDRVIRSGDTATLTCSERLALSYAAGSLESLPWYQTTIHGLLERFPVALSPMTINTDPENEEAEEDERIWNSAKNKPD